MYFIHSEDEIHFTEMFENHPSKIAGLVFSAVGTIVGTFLQILVIKYEREKSNRTLINQLISTMNLLSIPPNLAMQVLTSFHYIFPILPEFVCYLDVILRPSVVMMLILFIDAIAVIRYMFIFQTKNPTTVQDDFWNLFLSLWICRDFKEF